MDLTDIGYDHVKWVHQNTGLMANACEYSPSKTFGFRKKKVKQSHYRPLGSQEIEAPRFLDNRHMKVVKLSDQRTGRLYPPGNIPGTHFC
jgi:hypothetical protein